jgi:hypothetical protein
MRTLTQFLLNQDPRPGEVDTRAFSLTKVLSSAAIIVGPLATVVVDTLTKINFSAGQIVALAIGLLGFLAITASADVLGRSYAAAGRGHAPTSSAGFVPFPHAVAGQLISPDADPSIKIYASAFGDRAYFLVSDQSGVFSWMPAASVTFGDGTGSA